MNDASPKQEALAIIDRMNKIGFPNPANIAELTSLAANLHKLSHQFIESDRIAASQISKAIQKIDHMLQREGDVDEKLYTVLNRKLILLKTGLQNHY